MRNPTGSKERIQGIVFARVFCTMGIIVFHYFCHARGSFKFMFASANAPWGVMLVTAFFAISGAVLRYNHPTVISLRVFYFKRWKSIFPPFYLAFLFFFLRKVFQVHKVFYGPSWSRILLSFCGVDGYFSYKIPNYYQVGEWFLGAIVMLYAVYPLLSFVENRNRFVVPLFLLGGYAWMLGTDFFEIGDSRNFITCIASFYLGMVFADHKEFFFGKRTTGVAAFGILSFLCCVELPKCLPVWQLQGLVLLIVLVQVGGYAMRTRAKGIIAELNALSFCVFLFQHKVIIDMLGVYNPDQWPQILATLGATILSVITCAKILAIVVDSVTGSACFKFVESKILGVPTHR